MPIMPTNNSKILAPNRKRRRSAFSLVEMLVVLAVLALLIGMAFKGATAMTDSGKVRETEGLIASLMQAIDAYKLEVKQSRASGGNVGLLYNGSPPDDLDVFSVSGATIGTDPPINVRLAAGNPDINDIVLNWTDPRNSGAGTVNSPGDFHHGDVRAMVLAMRLRSPKASEILDGINAKYRVKDDAVFDPGDDTDPIPLVYYVDAWGTPIEYYSICSSPTSSVLREKASFAFVHSNNTEPLLVSYGPNGREQFSADIFSDPSLGDTSIIADFFEGDVAMPEGKINHELNQDNVYSSEAFKNRMQ